MRSWVKVFIRHYKEDRGQCELRSKLVGHIVSPSTLGGFDTHMFSLVFALDSWVQKSEISSDSDVKRTGLILITRSLIKGHQPWLLHVPTSYYNKIKIFSYICLDFFPEN